MMAPGRRSGIESERWTGTSRTQTLTELRLTSSSAAMVRSEDPAARS